MKFKKEVRVELFSRLSMYDPKDFHRRLELREQYLPLLTPTHWSRYEPIRTEYDLNKIDDVLPEFWTDTTDTIHWKKNKAAKATGSFGVAYFRGSEDYPDSHSDESFSFEYKDKVVEQTIEYMKSASVELKVDIACMEIITDRYFSEHFKFAADYACGFNIGLGFATYSLKHMLNDIHWVTVFGKPYVDLFGMDKLLSTPAFKVTKLSDDSVMIQLTEHMMDLYDNYEQVQEIRENVKQHLGKDAFFCMEKAYPINNPVILDETLGERDNDEYWVQYLAQEKEIAKLNEYGDVFKTPRFNMINDAFEVYRRKP